MPFPSRRWRAATCGAILTMTTTTMMAMMMETKVAQGSLFERVVHGGQQRRRQRRHDFAFGRGQPRAVNDATAASPPLSRKRKVGHEARKPLEAAGTSRSRRHGTRDLSVGPPLLSPPLVTEGLLEFHLDDLDVFDEELADAFVQSLSLSMSPTPPIPLQPDVSLSFSVYYILEPSMSLDVSMSLDLFSMESSFSLEPFMSMSLDDGSMSVTEDLSLNLSQQPDFSTMPPAETWSPSSAPHDAARTLQPTGTLSPRVGTLSPTLRDNATSRSFAPSATMLQKGPSNPTTMAPSPSMTTMMPSHEAVTAEPTATGAVPVISETNATSTQSPASLASYGPFTCQDLDDMDEGAVISSNGTELLLSNVNVTVSFSLLTLGQVTDAVGAMELALINTVAETLLACNDTTLSSLLSQIRFASRGNTRRQLELLEAPRSVAVSNIVSEVMVKECEGDAAAAANNETSCLVVETVLLLQVEGGNLPPTELATTAVDAVAQAISDGSLLPAENQGRIEEVVLLSSDALAAAPTGAPTAREADEELAAPTVAPTASSLTREAGEQPTGVPTSLKATTESGAPSTPTDDGTSRQGLPATAAGFLSVAAAGVLSVAALMFLKGCTGANHTTHVALDEEVEPGNGGGDGGVLVHNAQAQEIFSSESDVEAFSVHPMDRSRSPSEDVSMTDYSTSATSAAIRDGYRFPSSLGGEAGHGGLSSDGSVAPID